MQRPVRLSSNIQVVIDEVAALEMNKRDTVVREYYQESSFASHLDQSEPYHIVVLKSGAKIRLTNQEMWELRKHLE